MTRNELRDVFHNEQGIKWENSQGEPDIDYVEWLENKVLAVKNHRKVITNSPYNVGKVGGLSKHTKP